MHQAQAQFKAPHVPPLCREHSTGSALLQAPAHVRSMRAGARGPHPEALLRLGALPEQQVALRRGHVHAAPGGRDAGLPGRQLAAHAAQLPAQALHLARHARAQRLQRLPARGRSVP